MFENELDVHATPVSTATAGDVVVVRTSRTFNTKVSTYLGQDERGKDIRVAFPVVFRSLASSEIKRLQEDGQDGAFVRAVLVSAKVSMTDAAGNPEPDQMAAITNDPAISAAIVTKYIAETIGKNDYSKK